MTRPPDWRRLAGTALPVGGLVAVWLGFAVTRWARWGDVTVDSGREAYVPWLLSHGRTLYLDVWYPYGPVGPYLNAALMRGFGATFTTLYLAGLLALIAQAVALYVCGALLGSRVAGFAAGLVVLVQSVHHSAFSFPFPYAYSAVYGSTIASLAAVALILAVQRDDRRALFIAASLAALALLTKLEHGVACYGALAGVLVLRQVGRRSAERFRRDALVLAPGIAVCVVVIGWMVSLRDYEFITNENNQSWPGTHFMEVYGDSWIALTGGSAPFTEVLRDAARGLTYLAFWILVRAAVLAYRRQPRRPLPYVVLGGVTAGLGCLVVAAEGWGIGSLGAVLVPSNLLAVLALVVVALVWVLRSEASRREAAGLLVLVGIAVLVGGRAGFGPQYTGYSIYYNGLSIVALLVVVSRLPTCSAARPSTRPARTLAAVIIVPVAALMATKAADDRFATVDAVEVVSERGAIGIPRGKLATYRAAVQFMEQVHARGDVVLLIPEDTTLYFLAGIEAPTRASAFTPGLVTPGRMTDETIAQIEAEPVRYLLVSTRTFPEYGAPRFGIDFDQELGDHLLRHYREVGPLIEPVDEFIGQSTYPMTVWERIEP